LALLLAAAPLLADDRATKEAELGQVRERIEALRGELNRVRRTYQSERNQLAEVETRIGQTRQHIEELDGRIAQQQEKLEQFTTERDRLEAAVDTQRSHLAAQIRAAYAMGRQERLKLLLNQEEPSRFGRVLTYYDYLHRERSRRIDALITLEQQLTEARRAVDGESEQLAALRSEEAARQVELETDRKTRQQLVAELKSELGDKGRQLKSLQQHEKELERLIKELSAVLKDIPPEAGQPFAERRGKLPWPITGGVRIAFGTERAAGGMAWQGVLLEGVAGSRVHAVAPGRVAYADWLRGYGLILILDHGDGFMSLYGHNETLLRAVGDWVDTGDVIATVGNSGGQEEDGLYFEIREQGRPSDPARWCKTVKR